jgi:hypothetical protein
MASWILPTTDCEPVTSDADILRRLSTEGELLVSWPPEAFERTPTHCFRVGDHFWIWQPEVGGVRFSAATPHLRLHPLTQTDPYWYDVLVWRSWVPAIYPVWNRQVLHASAVAWSTTGEVIAFTGPSGAGKSTTAYGLSRRPGWSLVADDTLAFEASGARGAEPQPSAIALYPLRKQVRLRQPTAEYFGKSVETQESFEWPDGPLQLGAIYVLDSRADTIEDVTISRLPAAEGYPLLLAQAHALTLNVAAHNQRLMRDYLTLAATAPVFRLSYAKAFASFDAMLDAVEAHRGRRSGGSADPGEERPDVAGVARSEEQS